MLMSLQALWKIIKKVLEGVTTLRPITSTANIGKCLEKPWKIGYDMNLTLKMTICNLDLSLKDQLTMQLGYYYTNLFPALKLKIVT